MERNKIPVIQRGDVAWGGQGRALGRVIMSDGARKEGQVQYWGRGCKPMRYGKSRKEESCLPCTYHIWLFCLSLNLSFLQ